MILPRRLIMRIMMEYLSLDELYSMIIIVKKIFDKDMYISVLNSMKGASYCASIGDINGFKLIMMDSKRHSELYDCVLNSCMANKLEMLKYIVENYEVNIGDHDHYIFRESCYSGNLDITKYLYSTGRHDLSRYQNSCIIRSCCNNRVETVKWLCEQTIFSKKVLYAAINYCKIFRHDYLIIWLTIYRRMKKSMEKLSDEEKFGIVKLLCERNKLLEVECFLKFNVFDKVEEIFQIACRYNRYEIAKFLVDNFGIDIHARSEYVFRKSCKYGYKDIMLWLYNLDDNVDLKIFDDYCFHKACINGHLDIAIWLYQQMPGNIKWSYEEKPEDGEIIFWLNFCCNIKWL